MNFELPGLQSITKIESLGFEENSSKNSSLSLPAIPELSNFPCWRMFWVVRGDPLPPRAKPNTLRQHGVFSNFGMSSMPGDQGCFPVINCQKDMSRCLFWISLNNYTLWEIIDTCFFDIHALVFAITLWRHRYMRIGNKRKK